MRWLRAEGEDEMRATYLGPDISESEIVEACAKDFVDKHALVSTLTMTQKAIRGVAD
jgi:hypothetical protein